MSGGLINTAFPVMYSIGTVATFITGRHACPAWLRRVQSKGSNSRIIAKGTGAITNFWISPNV